MARVFPKLPDDLERRLEAVRMVAENDPDYFSDATCPYTTGMKGFLSRMLAPEKGTERVALFDKGDDEESTVLSEVQATIEEMKGLEAQLVGAEPSDRLAFYKAKTQMLERWTALKEKLINMKLMSDFQRIVVAQMEEVLTKDQQQEFKRKLKGLI